MIKYESSRGILRFAEKFRCNVHNKSIFRCYVSVTKAELIQDNMYYHVVSMRQNEVRKRLKRRSATQLMN